MYIIQSLRNKHEYFVDGQTPQWVEKPDADQFKRRIDAQAAVDKHQLNRYTVIVRE